MARMGAEFYGRPSDDLLMLGVTGTSGKTTTVYLLEPILAAAGHIAGLIGTIETRIAGSPDPESAPRRTRWTCRGCSPRCAPPA